MPPGLESVPLICARLLDRSPLTSPMALSGQVMVTLTIGSSSTGRALVIASRKARLPAVTKAISLESTG